MYTRQELSKLKQDFWTRFGQYMQPIASAEGMPVNWVNYKTGISNVRFVMDADRQQASIAIVLSHSDTDSRRQYYNTLLSMKTMLEEALGEEWDWEENAVDEYGKTTATVSKTITGVNITDQSSWPQSITFLKKRIIALDMFWTDAKMVFEML